MNGQNNASNGNGDNQSVNGQNDATNENNQAQQQNNGGSNSGSGDNSSSGANDSGNGEKTFTQSDVNRMMAKEKQQGRNAVFNELGINADDADAINLIKAFMAAQSAANDGGDDSAAISVELEQAKERAVIAEMKADAMKAGVKSQYVDDAVELVLARYTDDNNDFNAILNELKSKYSIWFDATDEGDKQNEGKRGTGSSISSAKQQGGKNNDESIGKRLAGMRRPQNKKSSYFSS